MVLYRRGLVVDRNNEWIKGIKWVECNDLFRAVPSVVCQRSKLVPFRGPETSDLSVGLRMSAGSALHL